MHWPPSSAVVAAALAAAVVASAGFAALARFTDAAAVVAMAAGAVVAIAPVLDLTCDGRGTVGKRQRRTAHTATKRPPQRSPPDTYRNSSRPTSQHPPLRLPCEPTCGGEGKCG